MHYGRMPDLQWNDVKDWFDPEDGGVLPDLQVTGTTLTDWEALFALVRAQGWRVEYEVGLEPRELPSSPAELFSHDPEGDNKVLKVWPDPGILLNFWMWDVGEIDFDADVRELQGQERLDTFCAALVLIGGALGKRVEMYSEGAVRDGTHSWPTRWTKNVWCSCGPHDDRPAMGRHRRGAVRWL